MTTPPQPGSPDPSQPWNAQPGTDYPPPGDPPPGYPPYGLGPQQPAYPPPPGYPPQPGYPPPYGYQPYGYPGLGPAPGHSPPPTRIGWAVTALIFFWPLAIPAFINSSRVESRYYQGDMQGAQRASDQVRTFGVIALVVGIVFILVWLTIFLTVLSSANCAGLSASC